MIIALPLVLSDKYNQKKIQSLNYISRAMKRWEMAGKVNDQMVDGQWYSRNQMANGFGR